MNSDTKVGLALGILIMGIAVAFFFRVPTTLPQPDRVQQLAPSIAEIDQELKHRTNRPYLPPTPANDVEGDHEELQTAATFPPLNQIIYTGNAAAPEPLSINSTPSPGAADSVTSTVQQLASTNTPPDLLPPGKTRSGSVTSSGSSRKHEVKSGETLCSIAQHYLGSPVRFREIYEVNTDIMHSPDSLQTGMLLTIPLDQVTTELSDTQPQKSSTVASITHPRKKDDQLEMLEEETKTSVVATQSLPVDPSSRPKRFLAVKKLPGITSKFVE